LRAILIYIVWGLAAILATAWGLPAKAAVVKTPWNLAVVVEGSADLAKKLGGEAGIKKLSRSLEMSLRGLPLRVTAGLWLARKDGGGLLIKPAPAARIKGARLRLKPGEGEAGLDNTLGDASAWLQKAGGGSLLLIASKAPKDWEPPVTGDEKEPAVFCHVLAVTIGEKAPEELAGLCLKGGGVLRSLDRVSALGSLMHQMLKLAISPARLRLITHEAGNKPKQITLSVRFKGSRLPEQSIQSNRLVQLVPGIYQLSWPKGHKLGPGPMPSRLAVGREGVTTAYAGGQGELSVKALGADGKPLAWKIKVSRLSDGKPALPKKSAPFKVNLPAGRYVVNSVAPPRSWRVLLRPGQKAEVLAGPRAKLKLVLPGPSGAVRSRYWLFSQLSQRVETSGYTGSNISLLPGRYDIRLGLPPGSTMKVELKPGQHLVKVLDPAGELLVILPKHIKRLRYQVLGVGGKVLARGVGGKALPLMPGEFALKVPGQGKPLSFFIKPKRRTEIKLR
jgi:hypothetical protein